MTTTDDPKLQKVLYHFAWAREKGLTFHHPLWRHKEKGTVYRVTGFCVRESDVTACVLYQENVFSFDDTYNPIWCHPVEEFLDGRFEKLP